MITCLFESLKIYGEQVESDIQLVSLSDLQSHIFLIYDGCKYKFSPAERSTIRKLKGFARKISTQNLLSHWALHNRQQSGSRWHRSIEESFKKLVILLNDCTLKPTVPCAYKDILESIFKSKNNETVKVQVLYLIINNRKHITFKL